jgi:hypothetical protein
MGQYGDRQDIEGCSEVFTHHNNKLRDWLSKLIIASSAELIFARNSQSLVSEND